MRNPLRWLFLSILLLSFSQGGESPTLKKIIEHLSKYNHTLPQEKVYLHFDKPYYHPGDTIWFKAYLVDAMYQLPDSASKVLYVDLVREDLGTLFQTRVLKADNGFAHGNFDLGDTLKDGNYQIRAYTNWMRNFPESNFFRKDFMVYKDIDRTYDKTRLAQLSEIADVQFFPEGGDLVNGIATRVAFKAVNVAGRGIDTRGFILNNKRDTVTRFWSKHLGMGYFQLKPSTQETYLAYVKDINGHLSSYPLPTPIDQGYVMEFDNLTHKDEIRIFISHNYPEKKNITIIGQLGGKLYYAIDAIIANGPSMIRIPKESFPKDGIAHFTLFDQDARPQCERLVYIDKGKPIQVELMTDSVEYNVNQKVEMEIQVKDFSGRPLQGNFSLAVTDNNQVVNEPFRENINSYISLTSDVASRSKNNDLKGFIEQPAYYFDKTNSQAAADLDVLLMAQGWRRFLWKDVLDKTPYDTAYSIESGLSLTGRVTQPNGQPATQPVSLIVMIAASNGDKQVVQGIAGMDGRFKFDNLSFADSTKILVQGVKANKGRHLNFTFESAGESNVQVVKNPAQMNWVENSVLRNYLLRERQAAELQFSKSKMLEAVVVKADKVERIDHRKIMLPNADKSNTLVITSALCAGATNVFQVLRSKFAGIRITPADNMGNYHVIIRSTAEPRYLVDGVPTDASMINMLNPCELESIEVYRNPILTYSAPNGVIAFYTRLSAGKSDLVADNLPPGMAKLMRLGYATPREFYSPHYDKETPTSVYDYRSTVFWAPDIITDKMGKAFVVFWNTNESLTDITAVLEGMTYVGKPVSATFTYVVK